MLYLKEKKMNEIMNERNLEEFRKNVADYNDIDFIIKKIKKKMEPLQKNVKILKIQKQKIQQNICRFMGANDIEVCNMPKEIDCDGALKYMCSENMVPMKHEHIQQGLTKFFEEKHDRSEEFLKLQNNEKGSFVFAYIQDNRPRQIKETIRKVKHTRMDEVFDSFEVINNI